MKKMIQVHWRHHGAGTARTTSFATNVSDMSPTERASAVVEKGCCGSQIAGKKGYDFHDVD
jgi:hypothetical protein